MAAGSSVRTQKNENTGSNQELALMANLAAKEPKFIGDRNVFFVLDQGPNG